MSNHQLLQPEVTHGQHHLQRGPKVIGNYMIQ